MPYVKREKMEIIVINFLLDIRCVINYQHVIEFNPYFVNKQTGVYAIIKPSHSIKNKSSGLKIKTGF